MEIQGEISHPEGLMTARITNLIFGVAFVALFVLLTVNSFLSKNWDFQVFYRSAQHLIHLEPVYSFARDQEMSFKYPPWIAPLFLPLSLFSETVANGIWRLILVFCAAYSVRWSFRFTRSKMSALITAVLFYGVFLINILSGQIQCILLAASLYAFDGMVKSPKKNFSILFFALSAKVFNLFSLLGLPRVHHSRRVWWFTGAVCFFLSIPVLLGFGGNPIKAFFAFVETAGSQTGNLMGGRGGLPSLFMFLTRSAWGNGFAEWISFIVSFFLGGLYLRWIKKRVRNERVFFSIALALGAAIHPLAFSYSFAWAFPMTVFVVDRFRVGERSSLWDWVIFVSGLFLLLIYGSGIVTNLGLNLPVFGDRAIGCVLLVFLLIEKEGDPRGNQTKG